MERALYGPDGFFVSGAGPAAHFRTSVHASPVFAACLVRQLEAVDAALGHPARLDVVDVGAGRGELLRALLAQAAPELAARIHPVAVELSPRPADLPPEIDWQADIPDGITGLLLAAEWLDNVPVDVAVHTPAGWRLLVVDPATGVETVGPALSLSETTWLAHWWPPDPTLRPTPVPTLSPPVIKEFVAAEGPDQDTNSLINAEGGGGVRAEIGWSRDEAWAGAVGKVARGLALAVDYGHLRRTRPLDGTLTGYRGGRQVPPVPDGSCDVTAHVAMDSVASAGERVARCAYSLVSQREALRALGADGGRPPLSLASRDPAGYLRALAAASAAAELTDPAGLGGHLWLRQPVGVALDAVVAR
ncbi:MULTISPECIES: SAM-dependent methyltransferase [unclassified Micromonospora]|uniref:SAM-dependent methyltransferase n=1 Tax=unclassified Micromonospora TaxID=2617518 RepID=UPI001C240FF7|nr:MULTISPECIES: SAM-dependent methyltransferase [unclassified Micromonospora]MBU8857483.1 SAM-dependent methyltransferase [Micromonospora sp. WMMB482]MDM4783108.1 SAM-dependent methyltransferase [Micromonospora sp. b486]